jgi:hypothetical protein
MKMEFNGSRRSFIKIAAFIGSLAALFSPAKSAAAKPPELIQPQPEKSGQGYQLTEHIKKYYQTARL